MQALRIVWARGCGTRRDGTPPQREYGGAFGPDQEPAAARRALGLTIVSKLIQQIDGVLEKPEEGRSTVKIDFPLAGASSGPAEEAEERPRRAAAGS